MQLAAAELLASYEKLADTTELVLSTLILWPGVEDAQHINHNNP